MLARLNGFALLVFLLGGAFLPAAAVTVEGLYSAQVPVASSAPGELGKAYADGLRQVLLRVSGDAGVLQRDGVEDLLNNAESLVLSYQFLRASDSSAQSQVRMTFGAVGVNQALVSINAPVWGGNRPLTLAWVAVQDRSGRRLLSQVPAGANQSGDEAADLNEESDSGVLDAFAPTLKSDPVRQWRQAFTDAAAARGLPLMLPPAEQTDNRRLLSEVWGQFMGSVRDASGNLDHDLLAVVRISRVGERWEGSWQIQGRGIDQSESLVSAPDPDSLAKKVAGAWASLLADRYAVAAGEVADSAGLELVVDQVDSMADYADVQEALGRMTPVQGIKPVRVTAEQLTLRIAFTGELSQLQQYIDLDRRFVRVQGTAAEASGSGQSFGSSQPSASSQSSGGAPYAAAPEEAEPELPGSGREDPLVQPTLEGTADSIFRYQPFVVDEVEPEQAFESLYPTLRYQWHGTPVVGTDPGPG